MKENENKGIETEDFFVWRGYGMCLKEGWNFAVRHLKSFVGGTAVLSVLISLLAACVGGSKKMVTVPDFYEPVPVYPVERLILYAVAVILLLLVWVVWKGYYYTAARMVVSGDVFPESARRVSRSEWRVNSFRYLQLLLLLSIIVIPLFGGSWYLYTYYPNMFFWSLFVLIPVSVYLFPLFSLIETVYMVGDVSFWRALTLTLGDGTRNWGRVFVIYVVSRLVALFGIAAFGLQAVLLSALVWNSEQAMAFGDAATVPSYVYALEYIGWFVASLATLVFSWVRLTPMLYQYGALVAYGDMRKKMHADEVLLEKDGDYMRTLFGKNVKETGK